MQTFTCPACHNRVYFDNLFCSCGQPLYYEPEARDMWNAATPCANREAINCNWAAMPDNMLCRSCAMSEILPALNVGDNQALLARAERAKRWVLANLSNWDWFTDADQGSRPAFRMLSEDTGIGRAQQIMMGHDNGEITINITEADERIRVQRQHQMGEQYRSMVGHFRHEIAHFLFDRLTVAEGFLDEFRALFGDERADYAAALQDHYAAPREPGEDYITGYATAHPHEDWAETAAHLQHMVDFSDSFINAGLSMPGIPAGYAPYDDDQTQQMLDIAARIAIAVNDINRALDNSDLYPFVLTPTIREKIGFAHRWLKHHAEQGA
ncbi:MAG: zinc-binding metallopeptidase family protein [Paracoccus sp. (in: a-proteobacteria)]|jgi:hypothetical protein|uniref:zinc-binding metallopeptidase family protein n=1 Tax=unclassified Paracoccus (in: a-proteobacteria) TaxID=2688777 RepID=UPI000C48EB61|nr:MULTISPECIES: putative zinc-binding metallopeptidase [unclassified Paracoccus (in: a-proteobacteria)]MAN54943.1 hypothetical protein [Paracoccus sp. (in: a-proteobacteria)]|tara:strand:- start:5169 stop:6143 length:975 start_codon:yes stop_codon:yes gene_type:complete